MDSSLASQVTGFWREIGPQGWWKRNGAIDRAICEKFGTLYANTVAGAHASWIDEADTCLARVIVLDQFPRNLFRDDPRAFATDDQALKAAKHALEQGFDHQVSEDLFKFLYLPYMHCERIAEQEICVGLMHAAQDPLSLSSAITHRAIIYRFGRFPHRNFVLKRTMSSAEQAFLDDGGFSP